VPVGGPLLNSRVRAFDSAAGIWTTRDAYAGDVHYPMSQKSYMWNNNNPIAYSDPTGYCPQCAAGGLAVAADVLIAMAIVVEADHNYESS
jgi:RHS repeat-associated protein